MTVEPKPVKPNAMYAKATIREASARFGASTHRPEASDRLPSAGFLSGRALRTAWQSVEQAHAVVPAQARIGNALP